MVWVVAYLLVGIIISCLALPWDFTPDIDGISRVAIPFVTGVLCWGLVLPLALLLALPDSWVPQHSPKDWSDK